jgi:hypothetical protein
MHPAALTVSADRQANMQLTRGPRGLGNSRFFYHLLFVFMNDPHAECFLSFNYNIKELYDCVMLCMAGS